MPGEKMNIDKLMVAAAALKVLIAEQKSCNAKSAKVAAMDLRAVTQKRFCSANTDLNFSLMNLRRCHKKAWQAIIDADLETALDKEIACPGPFQNYEI
jgi:hypothetical protein